MKLGTKIIIFEGQDNCLKSTLIDKTRRLDSERFYHVLHYGKPPFNHAPDYQIRLFRDMFKLLKSNKNFILDRSHLGECVWGAIYRNHDVSDKIIDLESEFLYQLQQEVYLITLIDSDFTRLKTRDDKQSLGGEIEEKGHQREILRFRYAHELSKIKNKFFIDLQDYYKGAETTYIDDSKLVNEIQEFIQS